MGDVVRLDEWRALKRRLVDEDVLSGPTLVMGYDLGRDDTTVVAKRHEDGTLEILEVRQNPTL